MIWPGLMRFKALRISGIKGVNVGTKNGKLLRLIETNFDAFITVDRGLEHQQKTMSMAVGIVVLKATDNSLPALTPLIPEILSALNRIKPGQIICVPESDD